MKTDKPKPHPMAVGGNRPKPTGRGRPPKPGPRHEVSGRLKEVPNPRVIAAREMFGITDPRAPCTPLEVAYARRWIALDEFVAAKAYRGVYARAQLESPGVIIPRDSKIQSDVGHVPGVTDQREHHIQWERIAHEDLARLWESANRDLGELLEPEVVQASAARAMVIWKRMAAMMTAKQRNEVDDFCIREAWPSWMLARVGGRPAPDDDRRFALLVAGLRAIAFRPANDRGPKASNDDAPKAASSAKPEPTPPGPIKTWTTNYVDGDGEPVLTVERRSRKKP